MTNDFDMKKTIFQNTVYKLAGAEIYILVILEKVKNTRKL
jgi:hypothetical protein